MRRRTALLTGGWLLLAAAFAAAQSQWQDVIRNLRHPRLETRLDAVERLGRAGYVQAAEPVAALLADPDDRVQLAALDAELAFFAIDRPAPGRFLGVGNSRSPAQQAFEAGPVLRAAAPAPPALIDRLIQAMRDDNPRVRFDAVHLVGFIGEPPLPAAQARALGDELDHYDPVIRMATARALGRLRAAEASDKLLAALDDSNALVRRYAIEALGRIRERRALASLRDLATAPGRDRRNDLADVAQLAIARIAAADDRGLFREWLPSAAPATRRAAIEGLGRLQDRESQPAIDAAARTDRSAIVRLAALFALDRLGQPQSQVIASMTGLKDEGEQAREYLFELGAAAIPGIQSALQSATGSQRADLVQIVGYTGGADQIAVIEPFLTDRDRRVVRAATEAVARLRRTAS
jgi:HEAT repeat protein